MGTSRNTFVAPGLVAVGQVGQLARPPPPNPLRVAARSLCRVYVAHRYQLWLESPMHQLDQPPNVIHL